MAKFSVSAFTADPTLAQLEDCRKCDLFEIAAHYDIPVSLSLRKSDLKAAVLEALVARGILSLTPAGPPGVVDVAAAPSQVDGNPVETAERAGESRAGGRTVSPMVESVEAQPVSFTPGLPVVTERKPRTLPQFDPFSVESSPGSKLEARLKVRLARLQLEKEEREGE
ncbi:uncharacterized protein AKAME5_000878000 [Lates japonicus]|uniref:Uncharacterized protein n=1 Tax=Lates japonicus TaxID=270547 RepID=A0AAD3R619_LATJO|nr:uncharacterized protein AKAME5_000878000 [Lates japonicus]